MLIFAAVKKQWRDLSSLQPQKKNAKKYIDFLIYIYLL